MIAAGEMKPLVSQRWEQVSLSWTQEWLIWFERRLEQGGYGCDLEHVQVQHAQDFVQGMMQMQPFLDDRDQHIGGDGDPDLRLYRILAGAEERLDMQVLFDPFEK